jgi:hypothetical protein
MMKLLIVVLMSSFVGCRGVDRLLNGSESSAPEIVEAITSHPLPSEAPNFGLSIPPGHERIVYFGPMPTNGLVSLSDDGSNVDVFIFQTGPQQWFHIGNNHSDAFYYTHNGATVQYHGLHLAGTAYCIYQYVPEVKS